MRRRRSIQRLWLRGLSENAPCTVVDFSARWKMTRNDTLRFDVSNPFERGYYEKADYTMPGRWCGQRPAATDLSGPIHRH